MRAKDNSNSTNMRCIVDQSDYTRYVKVHDVIQALRNDKTNEDHNICEYINSCIARFTDIL